MVIAARRWTRKGLRIIFANDSMCSMTGYTGAELRLQGQGILHENKKDLKQLHHWQTKLAPGSILAGEGFLTCKDGSRVYACWNYCPVSDERGRVTHIVATYRDLTEKRRLEEALVHSQRLDAVGRLAGGVAHDFNNLLSVINGYCEMMASKPGVRKLVSRELGEIHQASEKAANLVGQLLAFSRRQANHPKVVNLNQLVRENASILTRLLKPARSLEFTLDATKANIRVDPAQIQQVLLNLTLNARDALPEGGRATISTNVCRLSPDNQENIPHGNYAVLSVTDNGTGMDDEVRTHLFEPFFTTKESGKGTGLGLALVYGVVKQSNGFIRVQSMPGHGSTFEIFLPLVSSPAQPSGTKLPHLPATKGREHLLVIEEDEVLRKMVAEILTADGYTVDAAASAHEALKILKNRRTPIDMIISQSSAKRSRDEDTLANSLNLMLPEVRVLKIGNPESQPFPDINPALQANLEKPFTLSALLKATRTLLDQKTAAHV